MRLTYGQILTILRAAMHVHPRRQSAVVSRFAQISRLGCPSTVARIGTRTTYDLDATVEILLTFALLDAAVLPPQAVTLAREAAPDLAAANIAILKRMIIRADGVELEPGSEDLIFQVALHAQQRWREAPTNDESQRPERVGYHRITRRAELSEPVAAETPGTFPPPTLAVDLTRIVTVLVDMAKRAGWA